MQTSAPFSFMNRPAKKLNAGVTLTETLVVLVILGSVFTVMLPGYQVYMDHLRLRTTSNDLAMNLQLARSEAVRRRTDVQVCAVSTEQTCQAASDWEAGWRIPELGTGTTPEAGVVVTPNQNGIVQFNALGGLASGSTSQLDVVGQRGERCIRIGQIGRVRIHQGEC